MNSIDGKTIISINRRGKGVKFSVQDSFAKFYGLSKRKNHNWNPEFRTSIRSLVGDRFGLSDLVSVVKLGPSPAFEISLSSKKNICLSSGAHLLLKSFQWESVDHLEIGSEILTNGVLKCTGCGSPDHLISYDKSKFKGYCKKCMYGSLRSMPRTISGISRREGRDGYIYLRGSDVKNHPRYRSGGLLEHVYIMECALGRVIGEDEEVHHINGQRSDNRLENLKILTRSEHKKTHKSVLHFKDFVHRSGSEVITVPKIDIVTAISNCELPETFGIVMSHPLQNYVANGIIVQSFALK